MVKPDSVTVTAVLAASAVPPLVMLMVVAPALEKNEIDSVAPIVDSVAEGVTVVAKKPEG